MTKEKEKPTCQGCNKLSEIDGRLVCLDHRSIRHLYLNDYRVSGSKPWGGGTRCVEMVMTARDLAKALSGTDFENKVVNK